MCCYSILCTKNVLYNIDVHQNSGTQPERSTLSSSAGCVCAPGNGVHIGGKTAGVSAIDVARQDWPPMSCTAWCTLVYICCTWCTCRRQRRGGAAGELRPPVGEPFYPASSHMEPCDARAALRFLPLPGRVRHLRLCDGLHPFATLRRKYLFRHSGGFFGIGGRTGGMGMPPIPVCDGSGEQREGPFGTGGGRPALSPGSVANVILILQYTVRFENRV